MYVPDLIRVKRDGGVLGEEQIRALVAGIADGTVSDAQVGALAMAIVLNGMTTSERIASATRSASCWPRSWPHAAAPCR